MLARLRISLARRLNLAFLCLDAFMLFKIRGGSVSASAGGRSPRPSIRRWWLNRTARQGRHQAALRDRANRAVCLYWPDRL